MYFSSLRSDPGVNALQFLDVINMKDVQQKRHFFSTTLPDSLKHIPRVCLSQTKLCMRWRWRHPTALTVIAMVVLPRRNCGGCSFGRACSAKSRPEWMHRQPCCCRPFNWCTRPRLSSTRTSYCPHSGRSDAHTAQCGWNEGQCISVLRRLSAL